MSLKEYIPYMYCVECVFCLHVVLFVCLSQVHVPLVSSLPVC